MADFDSNDPSPPEDGPQREQRVDLRRKVSLKFKEFQGFINEYSENVSTGGMFIRTASPQAPGTVFDFELTLGEDFTLINGIGEVVWARDEDEGFDRPAGMGVRFLNLDPESRKLVDRIVSERLAREALRGAVGAPSRPTPDPGREEWRLDAPAAAMRGPQADEASPGTEPEEPWWSGESVPEGAQAPSGFEPPPAQPPPPSPEPDEAPEPALDAEAPDFPRPPGPSPYAYSRSYAGTGVARPGRRNRRPLLLVLLAAVLLTAAVAGFLLIFPDAAVRLLAGGEPGGEPDAVATSTAGGNEARAPEPGGGSPAGQGASPGAGGEEDAAADSGDAAEEGGAPEDGAGELGFFEAPAGGERDRPAEDRSPGEASSAPAAEPEAQVPDPPPESPQQDPEPAPVPAPAGRGQEPPPQPAPEPQPAPAGFSRVLNVVWEARGDELLVTVHLDGAIQEWEYSVTRVGAPPPRDLVRIRGVDRPFPRPAIPVDHPLLERVRLGFHPEERENELHVVLDLPREMVGVERSEAVGDELRLYVSPTGGQELPTP
ncbi:MAG: TIGR02266 family protein [Thermoanaerobaculia bacterium]